MKKEIIFIDEDTLTPEEIEQANAEVSGEVGNAKQAESKLSNDFEEKEVVTSGPTDE